MSNDFISANALENYNKFLPFSIKTSVITFRIETENKILDQPCVYIGLMLLIYQDVMPTVRNILNR